MNTSQRPSGPIRSGKVGTTGAQMCVGQMRVLPAGILRSGIQVHVCKWYI